MSDLRQAEDWRDLLRFLVPLNTNSMHPDDRYAVNEHIAIAYDGLGDRQGAIEYYKKNDYELGLMDYLWRIKDYHSVVEYTTDEHLMHCRTMSGQFYYNALFRLAKAYEKMNHIGRAINELKRVAVPKGYISEDKLEVCYELSRLLTLQGNQKEAKKYSDRVNSIDPNFEPRYGPNLPE
jgi:tetratricopeptide (TPR) repeat protein